MRQVLIPLIVAAACSMSSWASSPGQPLDCSDWVIAEPGFACRVFAASGALTHPSWWQGKGSGFATDNQGNILMLRFTYIETYSGGDNTLARLELIRTNGLSESVLAYVEDRHHATGRDALRPLYQWDTEIDRGVTPWLNGYTVDALTFDRSGGRVLIFVTSRCGLCDDYADKDWVVAIEGFTTTFEVLQSYEPTSGPVSFRVPYMPEGFPAASYFDTYYGDLATVGDWSKAQPLHCGDPATAPHVGDYLTVPDPLPDPPLNHGRYYVTAVNYMGQVRYGRKSSGGVLDGRDPEQMPVCEPQE